jgi:hypothetical protein
MLLAMTQYLVRLYYFMFHLEIISSLPVEYPAGGAS